MNEEFSYGAVVFRKEGARVLFLLIYSGRNKVWGFPKGHIEPGEDEEGAARREIEEETGLKDLRFAQGFREELVYQTVSKRKPFKGQTINKHAVYFLCEAGRAAVTVDGHEITDFKWLGLEDCLPLLSFDVVRELSKKAAEFLLSVKQ